MNLADPMFAYPAVFIAGLVASGSPCVLVLIPLIIGYVGGYAEGDVKRSALYALVFSIGLAITFTLLGALAAITGTLLGNIGGFWKYLLSAVLIIMGLQMTGTVKLNIPQAALPRIGQKGLLGALLLGLLFGVVSSPRATPVLAVLLTYVASRRDFAYGVSLLFVYALAHTALIFVLGISTGVAEAVLKSKHVQNLSALSHKLSGVLFVLLGIFILWYFN